MGALSTMHRRGRIRRGIPNKDPLRKVTGHDGNGREILECGHHRYPREDFIGPTNAARRRCSGCAPVCVCGDKRGQHSRMGVTLRCARQGCECTEYEPRAAPSSPPTPEDRPSAEKEK